MLQTEQQAKKKTFNNHLVSNTTLATIDRSQYAHQQVLFNQGDNEGYSTTKNNTKLICTVSQDNSHIVNIGTILQPKVHKPFSRCRTSNTNISEPKAEGNKIAARLKGHQHYPTIYDSLPKLRHKRSRN
jgi:hypothetical protein